MFYKYYVILSGFFILLFRYNPTDKMIDLEREHTLIASLTPAEKRYIKLVGNAISGSAGSQQLRLFDILNRMKTYNAAACSTNKKLLELEDTLPTLVRRMRRLIFKCLQQLGSSRNMDGRISQLLYEVEFFFQRRQRGEALRTARRGHKLAADYGRYELAIPFIDWQRRILLETFPNDVMQQLRDLQLVQNKVMADLEQQQQLRHFQVLLASNRRLAAPFRWPEFKQVIRNISTHKSMRSTNIRNDLLTESLYCDVRGMLLLTDGKGVEALEIYTALLQRWQDAPEWINEFPDFYLVLFKNFQSAIFRGTRSTKRIGSYLALLPRIEDLPPKNRLDFERIRYGDLVTLGLNTGRFDLVMQQIPAMLSWLKKNESQLPVNAQLALRYNICITCFLDGNYSEAYKLLQPITQKKSRSDREDLFDFSRVLQAILLYQLGDHDLGEYMVRAARQFFKRNPRQWAFEEPVLRYLNRVITTENKKQLKALGDELAATLHAFAHDTGNTAPLLGLVEVQCWLESRRSGKHIRDVFLQRLVKQEE